ncbi:MAG: hypothetical protein JWN73_3670 [Betaproteobacteria bacterium]|nr:hypothetical protein [Betaproteobacteria bacterium]
MHEVRVNAPDGEGMRVAQAAVSLGLKRVSVSEIRLVDPDRAGQLVSAECATPEATQLINALMAADWFDLDRFSISTREVRAVASAEPVGRMTYPMPEPSLDILQDLWQLSHATLSYYGRAAAGGLLLADGMYRNNPVSIVVAALFLPYLSQVLALSLGLWSRRWALARHGLKALAISTALSVASGAAVALFQSAPMAFTDFRSLGSSLFFSAVVGVTAGLCSADDTGRRYLIGVAAAVQCGVFPVWLGACLVDGFPSGELAALRLSTFLLNLLVLGAGAGLVFATVGMRRPQTDFLRKKLRQ